MVWSEVKKEDTRGKGWVGSDWLVNVGFEVASQPKTP